MNMFKTLCDMVDAKYTYWLLRNHPKKYIEHIWPSFSGHKIDWNHPRDLNEKIQWLQFFSDTTEWSRLTDKWLVRDFIAKRGYGDTLIENYGIWENADAIDFDKLPEKFVLKCNHDSGSTHLINMKKNPNLKAICKDLDSRLQCKYGIMGCEPHYNRIRPLIIAEEMLPLVDDISSIDYKFWCFNGKVACCMVVYDRVIGVGATKDIYNVDPWEPNREMLSEQHRKDKFKNIPKPKNLDLMVKMASDLSKGFPEVRVDLYNIDGKIYFGEMTFTSDCGRIDYYSKDALVKLGDMVDLSIAPKKY